jgi:O-antigen/teichoic acid export membrane protein
VADPATTDEAGSLRGVVVRGAGAAGLSGAVVQLVLLATYITVARLAPPEVFGTFAAASILVTFGTLFVESGMTAALVHRRDHVEEAAATALVSTVLGGVVLTLLSAALAPVVGLVFEGDEITTIALVIAGMHLVNATAVVPTALLQKDLAYVRRAVVDPVWMATYGVVAAATLAWDMGAWGLVIATYVSGLVRAVLVWLLLRRRLAIRLASLRMWRELAGYARHVLASEFLRDAGTIAHTAGIGRILGTHDLGQFNFGSRIASQTGAPVVTAAAYVLFPVLSRISTDSERLAAGFLRALASLCFVTIPLSLAFFAFGESLVVLLLGERWEAAGEVLASLSLMGGSLALISVSAEVFKATGRPDLLPRMHLFSALAPIVAVALGVSFGIVVIGACTSVGLAAVAAVGLRAASRVAGVTWQASAKIVLAPLLVAGPLAVAFFVVERSFVDAPSHGTVLGLLTLAGEASVAAVLYALLMLLVSPASTREFVSSFRHLRTGR